MPDGSGGAVEALGRIKAVDTGSKASEFADVLNTAVRAIREVAGDTQRVGERADRAAAEIKDLHRGAKAEAGAVWEPAGEVAQMDARYVLPDGTVRFGRSVEQVALPDGSIHEVRVHGLLTEPYPVTKEQAEARNAFASFALAHLRARKHNQEVWRDNFVRLAWVNFRKVMMNLPGRVGAYCRRMFSDPAEYKRVIDKTAGQGGELIAVPSLAELRRPLDLARRIPGLVRMKPAPSRSFKPITVVGRAISRTRGSTTDDPSRYPSNRFTTSDTTVSVVDRSVMALLDPLWTVDAAKILDDPMGFVLQWLEAGDLDTLEVSFLHGDTNSQDTRSTWTQGGYYTAGDLDGAQSPLGWWIGWRAYAADKSATNSAGGTWDIGDHTAALALMKNHGQRAVIVCGIHGMLTQLVGNTNFLTMDKIGPRATLITGTVGAIGGKDVIISEFLANEYASGSGLYTGSGTSNVMVYVDPDAYDYWELMEGSDDFDAIYPERGAQYVGMVRRGLLAVNCPSTEVPAAVNYNL